MPEQILFSFNKTLFYFLIELISISPLIAPSSDEYLLKAAK